MVDVRFRTSYGWSEKRPAIIDPGSPHCIIPHSVWSGAEHRILVPRALPLSGIGGGTTAAPFGTVVLAIEDGRSFSPPLTIRAFLLPDDSEPLLLGFEDFLTHVILYSDYPHQVAYMEFSGTA